MIAPTRPEQATEDDKDLDQAVDDLLRDPRLLERIENLMERRGLVGEQQNRRVVLLAGLGGLLGLPTHVILKGESAGGKNTLVRLALEPLPEERVEIVTGLTEQSLVYHDGPVTGVFVIEEAEGQKSAEYSLRIAMSEGHVTRLTVNKDKNGKLVGEKLEVDVTASIITTTTATTLHAENQTRVFDLWIDESEDQTRSILDSIAIEAEEEGEEHLEDGAAATLELIREALRRLEPLQTTIPFARALGERFPSQCLRARRDFSRALDLIRVSALLHQRQRLRGRGGRVVATVEDYRVVYPLIQTVLEPSMSGLSAKALALCDLHDELVENEHDGWVWRTDLETEARRLGIASRNTVHDWCKRLYGLGIWDGQKSFGKWQHRKLRDPREEPFSLPRPEELANLPGTPNQALGRSNRQSDNKLQQRPNEHGEKGVPPSRPSESRPLLLAASVWDGVTTACEDGVYASQPLNWEALGGPDALCPGCEGFKAPTFALCSECETAEGRMT